MNIYVMDMYRTYKTISYWFRTVNDGPFLYRGIIRIGIVMATLRDAFIYVVVSGIITVISAHNKCYRHC